MTAPTYSHGLPAYLTDAQLAQLLRGINPIRVSKDPKGNSHVEAYEIRAHLNRIFGIGRWDEEVLEQREVYETSFDTGKTDKNNQPLMRWSVAWYARVRLTLRTPDGSTLAVYTEGATGDASNQPSRADAHDQACKTAASQALKRCTTNLGDQFGLSLYGKGSTAPLVRRILVWDEPGEGTPAAANGQPVDSHITTPLAPESEPTDSQRETSSAPPSKGPAPASTVQDPAPSGGASEPAVMSPAAETPAGGPEGDPSAAPVMDGHDDPPAVPEATVAEPSQTSPTSGANDTEVSGGDDAWTHVLGILAALRAQSPADALVSLNDAMEIATRHRLRTRIVPDTNVTLGALLVQRMQQAAAAKATQEREAFVAEQAAKNAAKRNDLAGVEF